MIAAMTITTPDSPPSRQQASSEALGLQPLSGLSIFRNTMTQLRRWLSGALSFQQNDGARDYHAIPSTENNGPVPYAPRRGSKLPTFEYVVFLVLGCAM